MEGVRKADCADGIVRNCYILFVVLLKTERAKWV